jgi:hypothetical protein
MGKTGAKASRLIRSEFVVQSILLGKPGATRRGITLIVPPRNQETISPTPATINADDFSANRRARTKAYRREPRLPHRRLCWRPRSSPARLSPSCHADINAMDRHPMKLDGALYRLVPFATQGPTGHLNRKGGETELDPPLLAGTTGELCFTAPPIELCGFGPPTELCARAG